MSKFVVTPKDAPEGSAPYSYAEGFNAAVGILTTARDDELREAREWAEHLRTEMIAERDAEGLDIKPFIIFPWERADDGA